MAGLYIHVPFCKTRCHYCNFYSMASLKYRPIFVDKLLEEINIQKNYLGNSDIGSIYLGGGTPSLLSDDEIKHILDALYQNFNVQEDVEVTLEANPDDINEDWVKKLLQTDVNRISLGVQSFHDSNLQYLHRIHNSSEAINAIKLLQDNGISNLTVDLIYGIPGLSKLMWEQNLDTFFDLNIPHLSAYSLTVEEKTPLYVNIAKGKIAAPEENESIDHFKSLISLSEAREYIHYEISNFALEGHYSRHNSIYWTGGHYLGLGPSAHSFNGHSRRWNKSSVKAWLDMCDHYDESFEEEVLSLDQRFNEYVMTSLRTAWGCNITMVQQQFGKGYARHLLNEAAIHIKSGKLEKRSNRLYLSSQGKLFADGIASDLFI